MKLIGLNPFRPSRKRSEAMGPAQFEASPPTSTEVVVVGGGIAGLATAIALAERGRKVTLLEKGRIGAEQTSRALGWVASIGDEGLRLPLSLRSKAIWQSWQETHGIDTSYRRCGVTILCRSDAEMAALANWRKTASAFGQVDAEPLGLDEMSRRMPAMNIPDLVGAWHQASDGRVVPSRVAPALASIAERAGVVLCEGCAVIGLETIAGAVSQVVTEAGSVQCEAVVVAGGAWSRGLMHGLGPGLVQLPVYSSLYRTGPVSSRLEACGATGSFGWAKEADGSYTFGNNSAIATATPDSLRLWRAFLPALRDAHAALSLDLDRDFWAGLRQDLGGSAERARRLQTMRIGGAAPDYKTGEHVLGALRSEFPDFARADIRSAWAGVIDGTPDKAPVLGPHGPEGLFVCTGFSAHGLAMAPAAAEITADLVTGRTPFIDALAYSNARFVA